MRRLPWLAMLLLGACKDEPDFDARYKAASEEIEARAKALDAAADEADDGALIEDTNAPASPGR